MVPSPAFVPPGRVGQIAIPVRDLDRAVTFYADTLGLRLLFRAPPGLLPGAYTALCARGVRFVDPPHCVARLPDHDLWMAFCRDSEENLLALMSEVRPSVPV